MGYRQLSIEERCEIARLRAEGAAVRQIAAALDRAPSTVARELKRNGSRSGGYRSVYAHEQARARRWTGARLERDDELRACVLERLSWGWSPEQIAGHLAEAAGPVISYGYLPVHLRPGRPAQEPRLEALSATGEVEARQTAAQGSSSASLTADRSPNAPRRRLTAEGGRRIRCCLGGRGGGARPARAPLAPRAHGAGPSKAATSRSPHRHAGAIAPGVSPDGHLRQWDRVRPPPELHDLIETFFRHLLAVAEGGSRERHRPAASLPAPNLAEVPEERFTEVALAYNNRKCLGYRSSAEIFKTRVLHFKCEFTFPLSRE